MNETMKGSGASDVEGILSARERWLRALSGQPTDRIPSMEIGVWPQAVERWYGEGLPRDVRIGNLMLGNDYFGLDRLEFLDISVRPIPPFEEETLEETERHRVFRDIYGVTRKRLKAGSVRGSSMSMDQFLDFPVKCREDFEALKARHNPRSPARYPDFWEDRAAVLRQRNYPLFLTVDGAFGLYWPLRQFMGTMGISYALHDDPVFVEEMLDFWVDFFIETMGRVLNDVDIDCFDFSEDCAGKNGPLLSPAMFQRFLVPRYRKIADFLRSHGVEFIFSCSDGYTVALIPLWMEAGVNAHWPLEVAAGMDVLDLRRRFGKDLILVGGLDKRALAKDRAAIEHELYSKVPPMLDMGRYVPTLDHTVPPDVPYENWMYYLEVKRRLLDGHYS